MIGSPKVRAARKESQLARHKAKKGENYPEWFAKQPKQQLKAKVNVEIRKAKQELRDAIETLQVAEETGEDLLVAQENAQVASLFVQKLEESKRIPTSMTLTAAGGAT